MPNILTLWIGMRKGAFAARTKDRRAWKLEGPHLRGNEINHVVADPRDPKRVYATVTNGWFGAHIHASADGGKTWNVSENGLELSGVPDQSLKRIWHIEPGHADEPGVVYAGADPGAGGMCLHSIQCLGKGRIVVAISAAGAFRSLDNGATWEPHNGGVRADFMPEKFPEVGQCVHKLLAHPRDPETLYQQNHCGVYRGKFTGKKWTDINKAAHALRLRTGGTGRRKRNRVHGAHGGRRVPLQPERRADRRPQPRRRQDVEISQARAAPERHARDGAARSHDFGRRFPRGRLLRDLRRHRLRHARCRGKLGGAGGESAAGVLSGGGLVEPHPHRGEHVDRRAGVKLI